MILLDPRDRRPIYEQITEKLADLMKKGVLSPGEQLPSVRNLAASLSINPNTVQRSYIELERLGYIYTAKGKGSVVAGLSEIKEKERCDLKNRLNGLIREMTAAGFTEDEVIALTAEFLKGNSL